MTDTFDVSFMGALGPLEDLWYSLHMNTTTTPLPTDSFRALARRLDTTVGVIRDIAIDLGIAYNYSTTRRTWYLDADARTVRMFNDHLTDMFS